jgi:hypothetical protein
VKRGTRVGQAYVAVTADGEGINEEIVDSVDKAGPGVDKAGKKQGKRYSERFAETLKDLPAKISQKLDENIDATVSGNRAGRSYGLSFTKGFGKRLTRDLQGPLGREIRLLFEDIADDFGRSLSAHIGDTLAEAREAGGGGDDDRAVGGVGRGRPRRPLGDSIGRAFGRGSRSEGLHLFGTALGGLTTLIQKFGSVSSSVFKTFAKGVSEGFEQAGEGAGRFAKVLSGAQGGISALAARGGAAIAGLARLGPAAAAVVPVILISFNIMASVLGGLVAIITALSASILSGLVGALTVASAMFGIVTAGATLFTIALLSMTDAQKKATSTAFQPFIDTLNGLGQTILKGLIPAFGAISLNLQKMMLVIAPFGEIIGRALGDFGTRFSALLSGPGFQNFAQALGTYLPAILRNLGSAFGYFFNGVLGLFAVVTPHVLRFSRYLSDLAIRFSNFANSAEGRNKITDFVDRAIVSLKSVWGFIRQTGGLIKDLLFSRAAQNAGNEIFDAMSRGIARLRVVIRRAAANGDLEKWFKSGVKFAKALGNAMIGLANIFIALYNNGTLDAISESLNIFAGVADWAAQAIGPLVDMLGTLAGAMSNILGPIAKATSAIAGFLPLIGPLKTAMSIGSGISKALGGGGSTFKGNPMYPNGLPGLGGDSLSKGPSTKTPDWLRNLGKGGGIGNGDGGGAPAEWKNPYKEFAEKLIKEGPSTSKLMKQALRKLNNETAAAIRELALSDDPGSVGGALQELSASLIEAGKEARKSARDALNSAASELAGATDPAAAAKALAAVKTAQKDLKQAQKQLKRSRKAAAILGPQSVLNDSNVQGLVNGLNVQNATLADFAEARSRVAIKIEEANQKLADAISMRDDYLASVRDGIIAFGALTTAQAQTINGVEQALTAADITTNLQDRLAKIQAFQSNLRILLAQGLSKDAYKQLLDAGVEGGSQYAAALVSGGASAVGQVNSLTESIKGVATTLGLESSNRLYQAGVDAAKGLVDGLNSLSGQLDSAAARLGESIAESLKRALKIKSPSQVMMDLMNYVGDGVAIGLDNQQGKVGSAAGRLSEQVSINPAGASSNGYGSAEVSGNRPGFRDLHVHTPTEDPYAVGHEVLNEVVDAIS